MDKKVLSYFGFAAKARTLATGYNTCIYMMEKNRVKLLIMTTDLSENSVKKMIASAERNNVPYRIYGDMAQLSHITGNDEKGIYGLLDNNLAKVILERIDNIQALEKEVF